MVWEDIQLGIKGELIKPSNYRPSDHAIIIDGRVRYLRASELPPVVSNSPLNDNYVLLPTVAECRAALKDTEQRKDFWERNSRNFDSNVRDLVYWMQKKGEIDYIKDPPRWKIYITTGDNSHERMLPYDYDTFSCTYIVAASRNQGYEIQMVFNRGRAEFMSQTALLFLVKHEIVHVKQIAKDARKYTLSVFDDDISNELEGEAEEAIIRLPADIKKQAVLESIVYCYDIGSAESSKKGFDLAARMAEFFHMHESFMYGGGYNHSMNDNEIDLFKEAEKKEDINLFIDQF